MASCPVGRTNPRENVYDGRLPVWNGTAVVPVARGLMFGDADRHCVLSRPQLLLPVKRQNEGGIGNYNYKVFCIVRTCLEKFSNANVGRCHVEGTFFGKVQPRVLI